MKVIEKKTLTYEDQGQLLQAYVAYPSKDKCSLVILCHAWAGRDPFICEKAEQIAQWGFVGFALDMYGKGIIGKSKEENAALKKPFLEDRQFLQRRALKGFEQACRLPFANTDQIIVLGYGFGAVCALDLARSNVNLKGAISVYGHFDPPHHDQVHPIKAKVLILHGYNDSVASNQELQAFQQELDKQKVDWQAHLYGNTLHAFANPKANDPSAGILYNEASANRSWQAIENFIKENFRH